MKSKCCGAKLVPHTKSNYNMCSCCGEITRAVEGDPMTCEGCKWEEERDMYFEFGHVPDELGRDRVIPMTCLECPRHYAQLKDNYQSK